MIWPSEESHQIITRLLADGEWHELAAVVESLCRVMICPVGPSTRRHRLQIQSRQMSTAHRMALAVVHDEERAGNVERDGMRLRWVGP
jgi:hypothetical protein